MSSKRLSVCALVLGLAVAAAEIVTFPVSGKPSKWATWLGYSTDYNELM